MRAGIVSLSKCRSLAALGMTILELNGIAAAGRVGPDGYVRLPVLAVRSLGAASHGNASGTDHLEHAVGPEHFEDAVDLVLGAGNLDHQRVGRDIHDTRAERHH